MPPLRALGRQAGAGAGIRVLGALLLCLALWGCAPSPPVILSPPRKPIPAHTVWFYVKPYWPTPHRIIARLDTQALGGFSGGGTDCATLIQLRREAARLGANEVLLKVSAVFAAASLRTVPSGPAYQGFAAYSPHRTKAHALILNEKNCARLLR